MIAMMQVMEEQQYSKSKIKDGRKDVGKVGAGVGAGVVATGSAGSYLVGKTEELTNPLLRLKRSAGDGDSIIGSIQRGGRKIGSAINNS